MPTLSLQIVSLIKRLKDFGRHHMLKRMMPKEKDLSTYARAYQIGDYQKNWLVQNLQLHAYQEYNIFINHQEKGWIRFCRVASLDLGKWKYLIEKTHFMGSINFYFSCLKYISRIENWNYSFCPIDKNINKIK